LPTNGADGLAARGREEQANTVSIGASLTPEQSLAFEPCQVPRDARWRETLTLGEPLSGDPRIELERDQDRDLTPG
jgi:hypothetical protein